MPFSFVYRVGRQGAGVFALFEVQDASVVLRDPTRPEEAASDHLQVVLVTPQDELLRFAVDATADGPVQAWLVRGDRERRPGRPHRRRVAEHRRRATGSSCASRAR